MPRAKRGLSDGLIYHVLNRGNRKEEIFHKEQDFWPLTELIKEAKSSLFPFLLVFLFFIVKIIVKFESGF
jgi:hypothetical protein